MLVETQSAQRSSACHSQNVHHPWPKRYTGRWYHLSFGWKPHREAPSIFWRQAPGSLDCGFGAQVGNLWSWRGWVAHSGVHTSLAHRLLVLWEMQDQTRTRRGAVTRGAGGGRDCGLGIWATLPAGSNVTKQFCMVFPWFPGEAERFLRFIGLFDILLWEVAVQVFSLVFLRECLSFF